MLSAKFNSARAWCPGGPWKLPPAWVCPEQASQALLQVRAELLCQRPPQVSYLPCSFWDPPSCQGWGPAPLAGAPRTPFSDRLHSVMSQSLADITSTAQAQSWSKCGQVRVASLPGGGPMQATQPYRAWWTLWQVTPQWHLDSGDPSCGPS